MEFKVDDRVKVIKDNLNIDPYKKFHFEDSPTGIITEINSNNEFPIEVIFDEWIIVKDYDACLNINLCGFRFKPDQLVLI